MKLKLMFSVAIILVSLGIVKLYINDSATVEQAGIVEEYLKEYCRQHNSYPKFETVVEQFPQLYPDHEWYYWPNETWTTATFQYPMTLPLSSAPGRSKLSEFSQLFIHLPYTILAEV